MDVTCATDSDSRLAEYKEGLREKTLAFQSHMIIQRTRQPTAASYKSLGNVAGDLARLFSRLGENNSFLFIFFLRFCFKNDVELDANGKVKTFLSERDCKRKLQSPSRTSDVERRNRTLKSIPPALSENDTR